MFYWQAVRRCLQATSLEIFFMPGCSLSRAVRVIGLKRFVRDQDEFAAFLSGNLLILSLQFCSTDYPAQASQGPQEHGGAVSSIEALPNSPLPGASFHGWCGDRTIMLVDDSLAIFDGQLRSFPISFSSKTRLNCSADGQRLVLIDDEAGWPEKAGMASEIDTVSGAVKRKLVTYKAQPRPRPDSPSLLI